jgi:hypothetical protein
MSQIKRPATWTFHGSEGEDGEAVTLQIELGNDRAITLTLSAEDGPRVRLWTGDAESDFMLGEIPQSPDDFREWIADAALGTNPA